MLVKRKNTWDDVLVLRICNMVAKDMMPISSLDNFAEKLNGAVESWRLTGRVITFAHDNARNVVSANCPSRVNWMSVQCLAHTLQLAGNDGFVAHSKTSHCRQPNCKQAVLTGHYRAVLFLTVHVHY